MDNLSASIAEVYPASQPHSLAELADFPFLPSEHVKASLLNVVFSVGQENVEYEGNLVITNFRLVFVSKRRLRVSHGASSGRSAWSHTMGGVGLGTLSSLSDLFVKPIHGVIHSGLRGFVQGLGSGVSSFANNVKYSTGGRHSSDIDVDIGLRSPIARKELPEHEDTLLPNLQQEIEALSSGEPSWLSMPILAVLSMTEDSSRGRRGITLHMKDFRRVHVWLLLGENGTTLDRGFEMITRHKGPLQMENILMTLGALKKLVFNEMWRSEALLIPPSVLSQEHFAFDMDSEYARMGVPSSAWQKCTLNNDYSLCTSYPQTIFVPAQLSEDDIRGSATFHSKGRLPVLSWATIRSRACLCRCSQPCVGVGARSDADERYLEAIAHAGCVSDEHRLMVVDARPYSSTVANRAKNGGYVDPCHYNFVDLQFMSIENIHTMQAAWNKLRSACVDEKEDEGFWGYVNKSGWLSHLSAILEASSTISSYLNAGRRVLVHCSDGWDRTSQLSALAQLVCDPYYRTMNGFCTLCQKEFVEFGHRFAERLYLGKEGEGEKMSPVFLQFLDAVHQLIEQSPDEFEFNSKLLIAIADGLYIGLFRSFSYNSDMERSKDETATTSPSLWSAVMKEARSRDFMNTNFLGENCSLFLRVRTHVRHMKFWSEYFLRFDV